MGVVAIHSSRLSAGFADVGPRLAATIVGLAVYVGQMEREEIAGSLLQVVPLTPSGEDVLEGGAGAFTNFYAPAADLPSFRLLAESAMTTIGLRVIDFGTPTYVDTDLEQPAEANEALASVRDGAPWAIDALRVYGPE